MQFYEVKKLALALLRTYEKAWQENWALRIFLDNYTMPDGTKGVPGWRDVVSSWTSDPEGQAFVRTKFAALYERVQSAQQDSDLLELLRKVPPTGSVQ